MDLYIIGKMIKEFRERQRISQEDLCDGLCAVSTLSRIETGKQLPNRKLTEALLGKLGIAVAPSDITMTQVEIRRWNIELAVTERILAEDKDFSDMLEEYEQLGNMDILEEQQLRFFRMMLGFMNGTKPSQLLEESIVALRLTFPDFEYKHIPGNRLFTKTEMLLMNNIAVDAHNIGDCDYAINLLEYLLTYYKTKEVDSESVAKNLPPILFNLANWNGLAGHFENMLKYSEEGLVTCRRCNRFAQVPYCIFNKGWALGKLGHTEDCQKYISLAFKLMATIGGYDEDIKSAIPQVNAEFSMNLSIADFIV